MTLLCPASESYFVQFDDPSAVRASTERSYPGQHAGHPEDIDSFIVFLLSRQRLFVGDTTILVDGAISAQLEPTNS